MTDRVDWLGPIRVERTRNRLVCGERTVQLEPRAMQVLAQLLDQRGSVVPRAAIFAAVWRHAEIGDDTLNRLIFDLRRAIRTLDPELAPIETIRKVGYRIAAAPPPEPLPGPKTETSPEPAPEPGTGHRSRLVVTGGALALLALAWFAADKPEQGGAERAAPRPFTSAVGFETYPAFDPTGRSVYYSCQPPDAPGPRLCRRPVDATVAETIIAAGGEGPAPSPDGTRLAYQRLAEPCELRILDLATLESTSLAACSERNDGSLAWAPDGGLLYFSDRAAPGDPFRIFAVPATGGSPVAVTRPPTGIVGDLYPAISPNGRELAFLRAERAPTTSTYITPGIGHLLVKPLGQDRGGDAADVITRTPARITGLAWFDSRLLWFSDAASPGYRLWVAGPDREPEVLLGGFDGIPRQPTINRSGLLVAESWTADADLWSRSLDGRAAPRQVFSSTRFDFGPAVSPDGQRVAWTSTRDGRTRIWFGSPDSDAPQGVIPLPAGTTAESPQFSPDGGGLAFELRREGRSRIGIHRFDTGVTQLLELSGESRVPSWSLAGDALLHASDRSGDWQVWRVALADERLDRLTTEGGYAARALDDGSLVFSRRGEPGLWRQATDGTLELLFDGLPPEYWGNWTLADGVVFAATNDPAPRIVALNLAERSIRTVVELSQPLLRESTNLAVDPVGGRIYYALRSRISADLIQLELE